MTYLKIHYFVYYKFPKHSPPVPGHLRLVSNFQDCSYSPESYECWHFLKAYLEQTWPVDLWVFGIAIFEVQNSVKFGVEKQSARYHHSRETSVLVHNVEKEFFFDTNLTTGTNTALISSFTVPKRFLFQIVGELRLYKLMLFPVCFECCSSGFRTFSTPETTPACFCYSGECCSSETNVENWGIHDSKKLSRKFLSRRSRYAFKCQHSYCEIR